MLNLGTFGGYGRLFCGDMIGVSERVPLAVCAVKKRISLALIWVRHDCVFGLCSLMGSCV